MVVKQETSDSDYYHQRAREERALAEACREPAAALAHLKLAAEYEKRAWAASATD